MTYILLRNKNLIDPSDKEEKSSKFLNFNLHNTKFRCKERIRLTSFDKYIFRSPIVKSHSDYKIKRSNWENWHKKAGRKVKSIHFCTIDRHIEFKRLKNFICFILSYVIFIRFINN